MLLLLVQPAICARYIKKWHESHCAHVTLSLCLSFKLKNHVSTISNAKTDFRLIHRIWVKTNDIKYQWNRKRKNQQKQQSPVVIIRAITHIHLLWWSMMHYKPNPRPICHRETSTPKLHIISMIHSVYVQFCCVLLKAENIRIYFVKVETSVCNMVQAIHQN